MSFGTKKELGPGGPPGYPPTPNSSQVTRRISGVPASLRPIVKPKLSYLPVIQPFTSDVTFQLRHAPNAPNPSGSVATAVGSMLGLVFQVTRIWAQGEALR